MRFNVTHFYNLALPYQEGISELINEFVSIGYDRFAIIYDNYRDLEIHNEFTSKLYSSVGSDIIIYPRFHISPSVFTKPINKICRGDIYRVRRKVVGKACIVSIDDTFFKKILNPNDIHKFDLITLVAPTFKSLIKLIKKPILFEYIISPNTVNFSWPFKKLHIIKLLIDKNKLIVSPGSSLYTPQQLANYIYGLVGYNFFSYNVVATLPIKLIEKCHSI